ncbi:ribonuclease H1 small subunit [Annulohypoxylon maeteangense]|uniref:ribonuclease H1 small subunit n=1 Tax=Annulohypoxylon maeteangense TaxID=1927788 RepID=UPI0020080979|nr:ribonuclease H1 small subunit [Annulohypoxylon maeteangense]KAI0889546.1 ribonuclease H1 small subunit [Annulohypoxylon maeteangense]
MAHPVLTVESRDSISKKAQVNLLPCRIHHDGNVDPIDTYWKPEEDQNQTKTAYLRGRKLQSKAVKLPKGYYGTVVEKSEPKKPEESSNDQEMTEVIEIHDDSDDQIETGAMQGKATFDELMIWNHESLADSSEDPYLRGMEEWISFAEQIHSYPSKNSSEE